MNLGFVLIKCGVVTDMGTTTFERRGDSLHFPTEGPSTPHTSLVGKHKRQE